MDNGQVILKLETLRIASSTANSRSAVIEKPGAAWAYSRIHIPDIQLGQQI
jgi:hypothetical protein